MITVTGFTVRQRQDGSSFVALEISGGLEMVQSQTTGRFYATVRRCTIPTTFDEAVARSLVGSQIQGEIVRVQVPEYDYVVKRTGEVIRLAHSYEYKPADGGNLVGQGYASDFEVAPL